LIAEGSAALIHGLDPAPAEAPAPV